MGRVRVGYLAFFRTEAGDDLIDACIDLGLVYKTDPLTYMREPAHIIAELYRRTLKKFQEDEDD